MTMTSQDLEKLKEEACRERDARDPERPFAAAIAEVKGDE